MQNSSPRLHNSHNCITISTMNPANHWDLKTNLIFLLNFQLFNIRFWNLEYHKFCIHTALVHRDENVARASNQIF